MTKSSKAARSESACDDLLIEVGRQWAEAYDNWQAAPREGESTEESITLERRADEMGQIVWGLEDKAAKIPAFSIEGVLVTLHMVGTHYHLMERDGDGWANTYAKLTWQAWDDLERLAGEARP
jgi:hypothetical protein